MTRALALILFVAALSGCSRERSPQDDFDHARDTFRRGDLTRADEEAKRGYNNFHTLSSEWAWKFAILRAKILRGEGRYEEVLSLLSSEPTPPPGELAVQKYRFQGLAYAFQHRFSDAEDAFHNAEKLCAVSEYPACADVLTARGRLQMEQGSFAQAQNLFERVLVAAHASGDQDWEADTLLDLSWAADEQAHFDQALDWADTARRMAAARGGIAEKSLGNIGWAYYKLGDTEKAKGMLVQAGIQAEKVGASPDQVRWLTDAAYVDMETGRLDDAEKSFHQSLDLARKINSREDIINSLIALAFVSEQTGKLNDAKRYADEALAMARADGNGRDMVYPVLVEGRVAAKQHDIPAADAAFHQVAESKETPVFLKWEAERSLARLYEDENYSDSAEHEYKTALSTFEAARCDLHQHIDSRLPFLTNAARIYEDYIHFLVSKGRTNDALQVADYTRARTLAEGLGRPCKARFAPDPLNAPEIALRAGGTVLFYALGQDHSYLWAITPREVRMFPLAANQSEIDAAVQRYRKKLEGPREILEASNDGNILYQMLIVPLGDLLNKDLLNKESQTKNTNVFIIPDSALNSLNFETLVPNSSPAQPKRYWIEDVTIANAASLRLLPTSHPDHENRRLAGKLLLVGNPQVPNAGSDNPYPELPNAAAQMEAIEKYFPNQRQNVFAREQASPQVYLNGNPEQFSYIHFVAHGEASRMNPLDSSIILSANAAPSAATLQDDSFKLYARDIINHPLHADLVTISTCYSTGNRTYSGEGLVGLSWAFLRAGAHNVVAALWDVSDASTPQLIDRFYAELSKGKSPAAALRTAKLSLLHNGAFNSPFYWAPFQLYTGS